MNFIQKLLRRAAPLSLFLLTACPGPGVPGGTVPPVLVVTTLAGSAGHAGSADGTGAAARFNQPAGVASDSAGNLYVTDSVNHTIRKITPAGVVTTLAGSAGQAGSADGTGAAARFTFPVGVASDSAGNLYVADSGNAAIRKITPAGGVTTLTGAGAVGDLRGIVADTAGNLYVVAYYNHTILKVTPAGVVTILAGTAGVAGSADGTGVAARFNSPQGITLDSAGNLYVADANNYTIRKITSAGVVTTLAGSAGQEGSADGTGAAARFLFPTDVASDSAGNIYVADAYHTIRKITPAGVVTTLAGSARAGSADGAAADATFYNPVAITIDPKGNIYVADYSNDTIRKIGPGYYVGGTVSGLSGSLILANSNGDTLTVSTNGAFKLKRPVAEDATYGVTVKTQPAGQNCTVAGGGDKNGGGTATVEVSDISISCINTGASTVAYTIGGTVSGLLGGLELQNSNGDKLTISASGSFNGSFTFTAPVARANTYSVTVAIPPVGRTCTVSNGTGTANAAVSNISVNCTASTYTIGVAVSGLTGTLVLQNNIETLTITPNGPFTFATRVAYNGAYAVTVLNQPTGQTCTVVSSILGATSGTARANVELIVKCVANPYTIGGSVSGLTGTVVLQNNNNNGDNVSLTADGLFKFTTAVTGAYNVTVFTQPAGLTCIVTNGSGTATANVSNVAVSCTSNAAVTYTISGMVNGLNGVGLVLQNNLGDDLTIFMGAPGQNIPFTFATPVASAGPYSVSVLTQPAGPACTVTSGGTGTATANVTSVLITCM